LKGEARPGVGRRLQTTVLGILPGLAHILVLDRAGAGTVFFLLFVLGADAAVTGRYLLEEDYAADLFTAGILLAAASWLVSYVDVVRLTLLRNYEKRAALRRTLTRDGVRRYAAGDHGGAREAFRKCLDLDARDPDALFWYGCVEARRGKFRRARRAFRRCLHHDAAGTWAWEVGRQLEGLDRLRTNPPGGQADARA